MLSLRLEAPGRLRLAETPIPKPGPGDVVVRVEAATTCGTDLKAYLRGHPRIPMPGPFGHEYAGVVALAGPGAPFAEGEPVMGVHSAPCQACAWCRRDQENLCESIMDTKVLGSYAEFLLIPARVARLNLFPRPDRLPSEQAALLEPLACVAEGLRQLAPASGDRILVIGPGAIGLMFVAALRLAFGADVDLAGRNPDRLAIGAELGATTLALDAAEPGSYDAVIECTGAAEIWARSAEFPRRGGKLVLFGGPPTGARVEFEAARIHYDQLTLLSPFHFGAAAVRQARAWLLDGLDLRALISGDRTLDQASETFADLAAGRGVKYVFRP